MAAHNWDSSDPHVVYLSGNHFLRTGQGALMVNEDSAFLLSFCQTLKEGLVGYRWNILAGQDEVLNNNINYLYKMNDTERIKYRYHMKNTPKNHLPTF